MDGWVLWVIAAVVLAVAEVMTLTFVLAMTAVAAIGAAIAAGAGLAAMGQWITFGATDIVLLAAVLPTARRHLRTPPAIRSGTARLIGTRVMTISPITTAEGGQVRINGEAWSARPDIDGFVIPPGQWVNVVKIDGATVLVHPTTEPSS